MNPFFVLALLFQGGPRVAVDREVYLRTLNPIIRDLGELARDDDPCRRDVRCLRDRLTAMQKALQSLRNDLEAGAGGPPPPPPPMHRPQPMSEADFQQLVAAINGAAMSEEKVGLVRDAAQNSWFGVDQVIAVMNAIAFSQQKVDAAALMYPRVLDQKNWFKVYGALSFSADKAALRKRVGG